MLRRNITGLMVCIMCLGAASLSFAGNPDLNLSSYAAASGTAEVSVFCTPDGNGKMMTEAKLEAGGSVDATITVNLLDAGGNPVYLYPFEDVWVETDLGGLLPCNGGTTADGSSDINGDMTFSGAFYAGGGSDRVAGEVCIVVVNGLAINQAGLPILFNSGDLSGDVAVDLTDTILFVPVYTGGSYSYSIDYLFDGIINLSDLIFYAGTLNVGCP